MRTPDSVYKVKEIVNTEKTNYKWGGLIHVNLKAIRGIEQYGGLHFILPYVIYSTTHEI